jgi:hypothetical protein
MRSPPLGTYIASFKVPAAGAVARANVGQARAPLIEVEM